MTCYVYAVVIFVAISLRPTISIRDCNDFYKGSGPQSTFQMPQDGQGCSKARPWQISHFQATSQSPQSSLDTTNFTAKVTKTGLETSLVMCSSLGEISKEDNPWPNGGYCVPTASTTDCKSHLVQRNVTIKAPGRKFVCGTNASPLFNCDNDSFQINACCPKVMTGDPYLAVPFYNSTFYLIRSNTSCPQAYSFTVQEEKLILSNASVKGDMAEFITRDSNNTISLHFCKYMPVKCDKKPVDSLTSMIQYDFCLGDSRVQKTICKKNITVQPDNNNTEQFEGKCLPSGKYSSWDKFCGKQCPALATPNNSTLTTNSTQCDITVNVMCGDGSVVQGNANTTCLRNGTWSKNITSTSCLYVECDKAKLSTTSKKVWTNDGSSSPYSYNHNIRYHCEDRQMRFCFHLKNDVDYINVTCQANGTWSPIPKCVRGGQCTNPGNMSNALVNSTEDKFNCDSKIKYTCTDHHISETPLTLTCMPNKTTISKSHWDYPAPECNKTVCSNPQLYLSNGVVYGISPPRNETQLNNTQYNIGDTVGYRCNPMYALRGEKVISCQKDGTWNGTTISCWEVVCPVPPQNISHGYRVDEVKKYILNTEIIYNCEGAGRYVLNYTDPVSCNEQGQWDPYIPECLEVTCGVPPFVNNSISTPGPFALDTEYNYTCKPGYNIDNLTTIVCTVPGWNGTLPSCDPVICRTSPPSIPKGTYTTSHNSTTYSYNTAAKYTCYKGFNSTSYVTNCSQDASWKPQPLCSEVFCKRPGIPHSEISVVKDLYKYMENITVTCSKHSIYHPPQVLMCSDDGVWVSVDGKTIDCYIPPVTEPQIGTKPDKYILIGGGAGLFIFLIAITFFFVLRKRAQTDSSPEPFADTRQFSINPGYKHKGTDGTEVNELQGFENPERPGFEDESRHSFSINKQKSRLVLHDEAGYTCTEATNRLSKEFGEEGREWTDSSGSLNYDTLRSSNVKATIVSEPLDGEYNTLSRINMAQPDLDDDGHYNVISQPQQLLQFTDENTEESVYNIPTNSLTLRARQQTESEQSEVNEVYSNKSAAQLCGTPIEEDFDNMIYDNI